MSQLDSTDFPSSLDRDSRSRFTYRDLKNLGRASTTCPLRVIALVDFDAFYAQCETVRLGLPQDQPLCVQQFNAIIALNYAAKAAGIKRGIAPDQAKLKCPTVFLQHVATWREGDTSWAYRPDANKLVETDKAALDPYRLQSRKAFDLIKTKLPPPPVQKVEKASIDEVFLDLSAQVYATILQRYSGLLSDLEHADNDSFLPLPETTLLAWQTDKLIAVDPGAEVDPPDWDDVALNIGSEVVRGIRQALYDETKYTCSAGIAHNKTTAKLAAGHNKPNQQTVVRARAVGAFFADYKFTKIRGLGGKLGQQVVKAYDTDQISELLKVSLQDMRNKIGSSAPWIYNVIRGLEYSEVVERTQLQSMLAQKTFQPRAQNLEHAEKWLRIFAGDLMGRLEEQDAASRTRRPRAIALHHAIDGRFGPTKSKQMQIPPGVEINAKLLFDLSRTLLVQISREGPAFPCLEFSISLNDFQNEITGNHQMTSFFRPQARITEVSAEEGDPGHAAMGDIHEPSGSTKRKRDSLDLVPSTASKRVEKSSASADKYDPGGRSDLETDHQLGTTCEEKSEADLYCCPTCNAYLDNASVLEHLDWHVAKELEGR